MSDQRRYRSDDDDGGRRRSVIRTYAGSPEDASRAFAEALRDAPPGEVSTVTWADGGLVVVYRPGPGYDLFRLSFAVIAALVFGFAGLELTTLHSVRGDTVAEFFYHGVGTMSWGLALLSLAVGLRRS